MMENEIKNEKNSKLFLLILITLIIFFEPQAFKEPLGNFYSSVDAIYKVFKLLFGTLTILVYLKNGRYSKIFILMILFQVIGLTSTIISSGSITSFFGPAYTTIVMIACGELIYRNDFLNIIARKIVVYFRFVFLLNVITNFFVIKGSLPISILGIDNRWIFTYLPWMLFEFILYQDDSYKHKCIPIICWIISEISLIYQWSASAMIFYIFWIIVLFGFSNKISNFSKLFYFIILILNFFVLFFTSAPIFVKMFSLLGKDPTISGRTFLWNKVLRFTLKEFIIGRGMQSEIFDRTFFGTSSGAYNFKFLYVTHAHNTFLTVFYRYGIISLILFIYILYVCFKKIGYSDYKNRNIYFTFLLICMFLSVFDTIDCAGLYLVIGLISALEMKEKGEKKYE